MAMVAQSAVMDGGGSSPKAPATTAPKTSIPKGDKSLENPSNRDYPTPVTADGDKGSTTTKPPIPKGDRSLDNPSNQDTPKTPATPPRGDRSLENPSNRDNPTPVTADGDKGNPTPNQPAKPTPTQPAKPTPTQPETPSKGNGGTEVKKEIINEFIVGPIKAPTIPGTPGPGIFGLMLSLSDIEEMIPKLRQASTDLKDVWSKTINSTVAKIENSWAGEDARVYTDKVQALDPRVDKACQAIDLLAQTYQKVLDRSRTTVSEVSQKISSISIN